MGKYDGFSMCKAMIFVKKNVVEDQNLSCQIGFFLTWRRPSKIKTVKIKSKRWKVFQSVFLPRCRRARSAKIKLRCSCTTFFPFERNGRENRSNLFLCNWLICLKLVSSKEKILSRFNSFTSTIVSNISHVQRLFYLQLGRLQN